MDMINKNYLFVGPVSFSNVLAVSSNGLQNLFYGGLRTKSATDKKAEH